MINISKETDYLKWLKIVKEKVRNSQLKAAVAVNTVLLEFYWELGAEIVEKQKNAAWGTGFLKQLSQDLMAEFPEIKGFSKRNLEQIRRWYLFYNNDPQIAKQAATQLFLALLFYHTGLHAHIVIELKTIEFEPEHAGKLNFYIKAVDEQLRKEGDNPTIGILLCKHKDKLVAEYALSDIHKPMGVTEYQLTQALPDELKSSLPTIEDIEAEFSGERTND